MGEMPPKNQSLKHADEIIHVADLMRASAIQGSDFIATAAISLTNRFRNGLRAEGLDGGGRMSRYLTGGDAAKTAKWICEPLHAVAQDFYNAATNLTVFKRRVQIGYVDAIKAARQPHGADSDTVVVR